MTTLIFILKVAGLIYLAMGLIMFIIELYDGLLNEIIFDGGKELRVKDLPRILCHLLFSAVFALVLGGIEFLDRISNFTLWTKK